MKALLSAASLVLSILIVITAPVEVHAEDTGFAYSGKMTFQVDANFESTGGTLVNTSSGGDMLLDDVSSFSASLSFGYFVADGLLLSAKLNLSDVTRSNESIDSESSASGFIVFLQPAYYYPIDAAERVQLVGYVELGLGNASQTASDNPNEFNENIFKYGAGLGLAFIVGGESGAFMQLTLGYEGSDKLIELDEGDSFETSSGGLQTRVSLGGYF
mgnify:CR=1 FL=1|tara:strand:+ start:242 stop:889 length:648 start_codon:yes stop_codon:yes gene_type:complete